MQNVYVTSEPAEAFHARVAFCLDLHNEAVKALRYEVCWGACAHCDALLA